MKRYSKMREVIHDGSKPPKLRPYTPPMPYLVEKPKVLLAIQFFPDNYRTLQTCG